jgi:hypothetical protein
MSSRLLDEVDASEIEELERLWAHAPGRPARASTPPQATLTITRNSPHDFSDRQIYVWVDDEACGKIRYGESIVRDVNAGRHRVRVFNTLLSRTVTLDLAAGEHARLRCGTGMPTAGWLMMVFLHVTYLRVWLERE